MAALWGGRFVGKPSTLFKRFNDSLPFDQRLVLDDIDGSIAWARALGRARVLSRAEVARLVRALGRLRHRESNAARARIGRSAEEDVHSFVEKELIRIVGPLGKKLHTGRSRNDQVATDIRLHCLVQVARLLAAIHGAVRSIVQLAEREHRAGTILPGYTHLQRGQPVMFSHWCLAYAGMLRRDFERFQDSLKRIRISPLGCGALAGTAYPINREALARDLGFLEPAANSLDAVSDRDFGFEVISAATLCSIHLSRLAEDLVLYSSTEFGFVQMADAVTSGSSLMPQKKNPDAMELIRGKSGRILGNLVRMATVLKGLPLAYNKDLQEDKEPLFDTVDQLALCLAMVPECLRAIKINRKRCREAADDGFSAATDLADYLVRAGVPFRDAHHTAGQLTRLALERGVALHRLSLAQMKAIEPRIKADIFRHLDVDSVIAKRNVTGGTAPRQVARQILASKAWLNRQRVRLR